MMMMMMKENKNNKKGNNVHTNFRHSVTNTEYYNP